MLLNCDKNKGATYVRPGGSVIYAPLLRGWPPIETHRLAQENLDYI
jgi:hypothetical protein